MKRISLPEPVFDENSTFAADDKLGRADLGKRLTELIDRIDEPLVIALDGGWGSGKSHFLKLWSHAHSREFDGKAKVIYFDAFANDFLDDPLVSLIGAITDREEKSGLLSTGLRKLKSAGAKLAKPTARVALAAATAGGSEAVGAVGDAVFSSVKRESEAAISKFWKKESDKRAAMSEFREGLVALTELNDDKAPTQKIVFIVDELDRCRPDYALSILETIKHFFAVPGVHFVLGANLLSLQDSITSIYGLSKTSEAYLNKFIHLRLKFSEPRQISIDRIDTWSIYLDTLEKELQLSPKAVEILKAQISVLAIPQNISLRDIERLCMRSALLPADFEHYHWGYQEISITALLMHHFFPSLYERLSKGRLTFDDISGFFNFGKQSTQAERRASYTMNCWRRALISDPGADTLRITERAFGNFPVDREQINISRVVIDVIDQFAISDQGE